MQRCRRLCSPWRSTLACRRCSRWIWEECNLQAAHMVPPGLLMELDRLHPLNKDATWQTYRDRVEFLHRALGLTKGAEPCA